MVTGGAQNRIAIRRFVVENLDHAFSRFLHIGEMCIEIDPTAYRLIITCSFLGRTRRRCILQSGIVDFASSPPEPSIVSASADGKHDQHSRNKIVLARNLPAFGLGIPKPTAPFLTEKLSHTMNRNRASLLARKRGAIQI